MSEKKIYSVDCCARCQHYIQAYSELDFGDCGETGECVSCYMMCCKFVEKK